MVIENVVIIIIRHVLGLDRLGLGPSKDLEIAFDHSVNQNTVLHTYSTDLHNLSDSSSLNLNSLLNG
jgi:hypothetical protein